MLFKKLTCLARDDMAAGLSSAKYNIRTEQT